MKETACVRGILGKDADDLTDDELAGLMTDLRRRQRERQAADESVDDVTALREAAEGVAADLELAAKVEKRNAALNVLRYKEARAFVGRFNDPARGLEALVAGSNKRVEGARNSVEAKNRAREGRYLGGLGNDLKREGLLQFVQARLFASGKGPLDDKIAVELYELRDGGRPGASGSPEAGKIAKIVHKYQELARADQNRAGAFIRKMDGYIVSQSHDMFRIRRAGQNEWIARILPLLDERTFDGADPVAFLKGVYDELSTGAFYKAQSEGPLVGFKGPANLAKKVSQSRVLHFRDAQSWIAYNDAFGLGSIMEAAAFGLRRAARSTALMETFGPNPRAMYERLANDLTQENIGNAKVTDPLRDRRLRALFDVADGTVDMPGNVTLANFGRATRTLQTMAKLGGAVLSSIPDIATAAGELRFQGKSFFSGLSEQVKGFAKSTRSSSDRRDIAERLGAGIDSMIGGILSRFDPSDNLPGRLAKLQQNFFRLNLLGWWTDAHETAFSTIMANDLAGMAGKSLDALPERSRMVLGLYNIGAAEWDVIRIHGLIEHVDGRSYVLPELLRDVPDDAMASLTTGKPSAAKFAAARDKLENDLRAYYLDRTSYGVLKGGIREKFGTTQGVQAGTTMGELARFMTQFKNYSISFVNKTLGRYAEADAFWKVPGALAKMPWGETRQLAQMIGAMTALGYLALAAKDLSKGKEPRDPLDPATWGAAALQGGGLGIYGDYLFMRFNRFGGGALEGLAGPAPAAFADAVDLVLAARDWAAGKEGAKIPDNQAFSLFKNNTPFLNLFYTRAALDYLVLYDTQEAISPGSLKRMERKVREEGGQNFLLPPSQDRVVTLSR